MPIQARKNLQRSPFALTALVFSLALTGCARFDSAPASAPAEIVVSGIHGSAYGGRQPIIGSSVQMWQAGTSGYASGATLLATVTTGSDGTFSLTGKYTCTSGTQVYITASGGNPGAGTNSSAVLMAPLGLCDSAPSIPFVSINELSTIAGVWSLAPFISGKSIGTTSTNTDGLAQAFADFSTIFNLTTGVAKPSTATLITPSPELNLLGDILASCVNSTGAGDNGSCDRLFLDTTLNAVKPADTLAAAINIAKHPIANVVDLINLAPAVKPYATTLSSTNDFTLAVTYVSAGIQSPKAIVQDSAGNVWIANAASVTELSHTGSTLGTYTNSISSPTALAVDSSGNIWVANTSNIAVLSPTGTPTANSPFSGGGLNSPKSITFDSFGNAWLLNASSNISVFSNRGTPITTTPYTLPTTAVALSANPR